MTTTSGTACVLTATHTLTPMTSQEQRAAATSHACQGQTLLLKKGWQCGHQLDTFPKSLIEAELAEAKVRHPNVPSE